jgi:acyl-[acyl-carrier-protein]-phospholipid O-acyltransferase/long-chain-fatty-acid--[acyl-carrier-protein] ligase
MISLGTALLIAPFLLFSVLAGRLTDRVDKGKLVIALKAVELGLAALAGAALAFHSVWAMLGLLFLMGTHSALMGPAKYALLPERVPPADLSEANGAMELGSFVAFMGGTAAGGLLYTLMASALPLTSAVLGAVAVAGVLASLTLRGAGRAAATLPAPGLAPGPWLPKALRAPSAGIGLFWFLTSLLQMNIFLFGQHALKIGEVATTGLLAGAGIAMGLGSFLAGKLSRKKVELGLAPWGLLGLTAFMLDLALFGAGSWVRAALDLAALSLSAGLFYIPLNSYIQQQSPPEARGRILGASNFISYGAILLSAGMYFALTAWAGLSPSGIFLAGAVIAGAALAPVAIALGRQAWAFARDFLSR